ncbi:putative LysM domain-containing protein [Lupinus albus]|uniref:Putative LysM domain-containing protein n=1 Tax=Lupinus albus TaxID=3870 RepID=A0A6A4NRP2_LUPAL|nr:putative LysM domain-containing protein [Lupinus albus]
MEMYRWEEHNGNGSNNGYLNHHHLNVPVYDVNNADSIITMSSSPSFSYSSSSSSSSSPPSTHGYIEHTISKLDTLAGIAIKYGLEVVDIKKMNSLITDHQMFALKTLRIPLHGRHPPSPSLSNGCGKLDKSLHDDTCREPFESFLSPKMKSSGQKLSPVTMKKSISVFEMTMYRKRASNSSENGSHSPTSARTLSHHQKCRSMASGIFKDILESSNDVEAREDESDKWNDTFDNNIKDAPEKLLALQENNTSGRFSSSRTRKSLALRQKSGSRTALSTDSESSSINPLLIRMGSAFEFDGQSGVRKSSSTSYLQGQHNNSNSSSICPAFSAKGIAKPRTAKRNKAALD